MASSSKMLKRVDGLAVSINPLVPLVALLDGPTFDELGYQRATRINGCVACTKCSLLLPLVEEVEVWTLHNNRWLATEWGMGRADCDSCGLVIVEGFDADYVIDVTSTRLPENGITNEST